LTHAELVRHAEKWLYSSYKNMTPLGHVRCSHVVTELRAATIYGECADALGWAQGRSILIECKTSRSDFKRDSGKIFRRYEQDGLGKQRYLLTNPGIITTDDLPEKWGFLEMTSSGVLRVVRESEFFEYNKEDEMKILLSVIRRMKGE